jgi:hypothetical protein
MVPVKRKSGNMSLEPTLSFGDEMNGDVQIRIRDVSNTSTLSGMNRTRTKRT